MGILPVGLLTQVYEICELTAHRVVFPVEYQTIYTV